MQFHLRTWQEVIGDFLYDKLAIDGRNLEKQPTGSMFICTWQVPVMLKRRWVTLRIKIGLHFEAVGPHEATENADTEP